MPVTRHIRRSRELEDMCLTDKIKGKRSRGWLRKKYMDGIVEVMGDRWTATSLLRRMDD